MRRTLPRPFAPSPAAALAASVLLLGAAAASPAAAQTAAPAPAAPRTDDPTGLRTRSAAFRDSVDGALARDDDDGPRLGSGLARRIGGGLAVAVIQPVGGFRQGGRVGIGVQAFTTLSADPEGILGLRLDGGVQNYGITSVRTGPVASQLLLQNPLQQRTSNNVYSLTIGPQLSVPLGPVRPYAYATVGAANFTTTTTVQYATAFGYQQEFTSTDLSNWALARSYGGGLRVRLSRANGHTAYLDAGARYQTVRDVRYLAAGSVPANVDPNLLAIRGNANFVTYHLGVSVTGGR